MWLSRLSLIKEFHYLSSYGTSGFRIIKFLSGKVMSWSEIILVPLSVSYSIFFWLLLSCIGFSFGTNDIFSFPCKLNNVKHLYILRSLGSLVLWHRALVVSMYVETYGTRLTLVVSCGFSRVETYHILSVGVFFKRILFFLLLVKNMR